MHTIQVIGVSTADPKAASINSLDDLDKAFKLAIDDPLGCRDAAPGSHSVLLGAVHRCGIDLDTLPTGKRKSMDEGPLGRSFESKKAKKDGAGPEGQTDAKRDKLHK